MILARVKRVHVGDCICGIPLPIASYLSCFYNLPDSPLRKRAFDKQILAKTGGYHYATTTTARRRYFAQHSAHGPILTGATAKRNTKNAEQQVCDIRPSEISNPQHQQYINLVPIRRVKQPFPECCCGCFLSPIHKVGSVPGQPCLGRQAVS